MAVDFSLILWSQKLLTDTKLIIRHRHYSRIMVTSSSILIHVSIVAVLSDISETIKNITYFYRKRQFFNICKKCWF